MMNKSQTNDLNIKITYEGEPLDEEQIKEYLPPQLTIKQKVRRALKREQGKVVFKTRIITFDLLHRTEYYKVWKQLDWERRRAEFESSIGLIRITQ